MPPTSPSPTKRIIVLEEAERAELYDRPHFTDDERLGYFTLPPIDVALMETFSDAAVQAFFVLTLGYFKAKQRFFTVTIEEVADELRFIRDHLTLPAPDDELRVPSAPTIYEQRKLILSVTGYRPCRAADRHAAFQVVCQAARISPKPQYLVRVALQHFATERLMLPGYSYLQEAIVGKAITTEETRLDGLLTTHLSDTDRMALNGLFLMQDGRYHLSRLQRTPKNLGRGELRHEREREEAMRPFYAIAQRLLAHLDLSPDAIQYYASLVSVYTATRLKDLESPMVAIYLLCFLYHRYHRLHDHLLSGFLHAVKGYRDAAKTAAEADVSAYRMQRTKDLARAGQVLQLFTNETIPPTTAFAAAQEQAFAILDRERLARTAAYIATGADCDETAFFWQHIDRLVRQFKPRLRPLLLGVDLRATRSHPPLLDAVHFLQQAFARKRPLTHLDPTTFPTRCIPPPLKRYLYGDSPTGSRLLVDRYEFFVYLQVRTALESGELVCRQSIRFRSLEDDLIPLADWQEQKERYLAEAELPILQQPITAHLADLETALEAQFVAVNSRIATGDNPAVAITTHGTTRKWTLKTPKSRESINHALFERLPQASLNQVLAFVEQHCHFMAAFEHVIGRNAGHTRDDRLLRACLIAWGTNHGLHRMGKISDIAPSTLVRVSSNYLRVETLQAANTIIVNALAASPLFRTHHIDGVVHSSSDGQKFEVDRETVNARYSPKYFGMGKGVVAATLVINGAPVNARLISAHDHESHWVFDLLYNNQTDLHPAIHSTDTHGTNQVNFGLLHLFGHRFAPRYADLQARMQTSLYGFQHPSQYGEKALFRPVRKLNTALIVRQWDAIQRIVVSLARKTTSQSILITKLSSAKRRNPMLQALWEYDAIHASGYYLDYVDSSPLRRNVQTALNRGEQYHQLRRALSHANGGKLRYVTEEEQEIWNETCRLLVNAILYYNITVLERAIAAKEADGDLAGAAWLRTISPVAWHHINFYGMFTFHDEPMPIPLEDSISVLLRYRQRQTATDGDDEVE